jgi:hypothetical protein
LALDKVDPERIEARIQKRKEKAEKHLHASTPCLDSSAPPEDWKEQEDKEKEVALKIETPIPSNLGNSRYISPSIRRQVYLRDKGRCTFQDLMTGRVCGSRFQIEIDHITPVSWGGTSDPAFLRLICRNHNQWEGIQKLGKAVMAPHIRIT